MFEFVRKHSKIFMGLMFLLIIPSFVLVGVADRYMRDNTQADVVARVGGQDITRAEWDAVHNRAIEQIRASNPSVDIKQLESAQVRYMSLERLVRERVLLAAANKEHLVVSDALLARTLQDDPTIASLRRPDGSLDMDRYRQILSFQGMTPAMYESSVRRDLASRQVLQGVAASGFVPAAQADVTVNAYFEQREIQTAMFKTADFVAKVSPTEADLQAYYASNQPAFHKPDQAEIEYVVLDINAMKKALAPTEAELKDYFKTNYARFAGKEERRARHILISAAQDASESAKKEARTKAEQLLAEVRKAPDSFADLAVKNSQDPGAASNGGDLGFFGPGAMVKPFEDAAFAMKKGDISDVVESEFGFHIIQLTDIKAPPQRTFEEVRAAVDAEWRQEQAQKKFTEEAEVFRNLVFEQADSLGPVAQRLGLPIQTATVGQEPLPGLPGALGSKRFLEALFGSEALEQKRNTEAVEFGPSQIASGRIKQHIPAHTQSFAEVQELVRQRVIQQKAAELARAEGAAKLAAWTANPAAAQLQTAVVVSRDKPQGQPSQVVDAALRANASKLPVFVGADLGEQGYAVVKVTQIVPHTNSTEADAARNRGIYAQAWSTAEMDAYYNMLKERYKAKFLVPKPGGKVLTGTL